MTKMALIVEGLPVMYAGTAVPERKMESEETEIKVSYPNTSFSIFLPKCICINFALSSQAPFSAVILT